MTKRRGVGDHEQFGHGLGELHIVVEVLLLMRSVVLRAQQVRASENVEGFGGVLRDGGAAGARLVMGFASGTANLSSISDRIRGDLALYSYGTRHVWCTNFVLAVRGGSRCAVVCYASRARIGLRDLLTGLGNLVLYSYGTCGALTLSWRYGVVPVVPWFVMHPGPGLGCGIC